MNNDTFSLFTSLSLGRGENERAQNEIKSRQFEKHKIVI